MSAYNRTIIVSKWPIQYGAEKPHNCWISRRGRLYEKYHKNIKPSSYARLMAYIKYWMIETCRAHENYIKYEFNEGK